MAPQYPNISSRRSRPSRQAMRPASALRPPRERSDVTLRLGQQALRNAERRYPQQQRGPHGGGGGGSRSSGRNGGGHGAHAHAHAPHQPQQGNHGGGSSSSQHSDGSSGSGLGQAAMSMLVGQLLEEVVDYVVRHNFFRRPKDGPQSGEDSTKNTSTATATRAARAAEQPQPQGGQPSSSRRHHHQSPASSLDERQRRRRHRRGEVLMTSLDRLSAELETTYDALMRVSHAPAIPIPPGAGAGGHAQSESTTTAGDGPTSLVANVDELRRAITRSLARIESVRYHHRAARRGSRSAMASRVASTLSRSGSDAR
jgi:hypothetical protein